MKRKRQSASPSNSRGKKTNAHPDLNFKKSPLRSWIYDLETLGFLDVNEAAVKEYGYSRREFLKMGIMDLHPAEDRQALQAQGRQFRRQWGLWRQLRKDGSEIRVDLSAQKSNHNGN